jgi:hypothetical protein
MHTISNPTMALELARLRSEEIRRDVRGTLRHDLRPRPRRGWSRSG